MILILILFLILGVRDTWAIDPQYIFVRKDPMNPIIDVDGTKSYRLLWNFTEPSKINMDAVNDVFNMVGTHGTDQRKLGMGVILNYNEVANLEMMKQSLQALLFYSKAHSFPIFLSIDGFQWLNPSAGYDPYSVNNAEWTCWESSCAINKSFRDWGSEFEVKPQPNLASPALINANKARSRILLDIVSNWYKNELAEDQKWLFGGLATTMEIDMGGNFFYPKGGIGKSVQLGYNAVKTLGLRSSGGPPTVEEINKVVNNYVEEMDKVAIDAGIPRNKIFNHTGGSDMSPREETQIKYTSSAVALTPNGYPGWSMYGLVTEFPQNYTELNNVFNRNGNGEWGSPEWLTHAGNEVAWENSLRGSLNYRNNRFVNIANWEQVRTLCKRNENKECIDDGTGHIYYALDAIKAVLGETSPCWETAPKVTSTLNGNQLTLSWVKGEKTTGMYLNMSNSSELVIGGGLKNVNEVNENVTSLTTKTMTLGNGSHYWTLMADGCGQRRTVYGTATFKVAGDATGDGKVSLADFMMWRKEFLSGVGIKSDFSNDGKVSLIDFGIWRREFLKSL